MTADPTPTAPSRSSSSGRHPLGTVYLFHFDQRYEHAGHYTGWAEDLDHRVAEHLAGRGARLIEVISQAGIGFRLARTWPGVTRARERQLKRQGGASPVLSDLPGRPQGPRHPPPDDLRPADPPRNSPRERRAANETVGGRGPYPRHPIGTGRRVLGPEPWVR